VKIVDATIDAWDASIAFGRRKSRVFDHLWRARQRYNEELGGRLAAAIAYYAFFATFALALVAYSIVGYVLASSSTAVTTVNSFLEENVPFLNVKQISDSRNAVAIIGLVGLVLTGVGWIESMRSAQRAIWDLDQQPGNVIIRRLIDLGIMVAIGLLLALSLWIQNGIKNAIAPSGLWLSPTVTSVGQQDFIETTAKVVGVTLSLLLNCFLAAALLAGVARLRMPFLRLLPAMLLVAVGLFILSTLGRKYIDYTANKPAYQIVGGTVALLLFLYLFSQLLLYGAAFAATSRRGKIRDLAKGPPPGDEALDRRAIDAMQVFGQRKPEKTTK
jgi:membrane protein